MGRPLRIASLATAVDAVGALAYGLWQLVAILTRTRGTAVGVAALGGVLFGVFGVGLLIVARALWRGRRAGRAPAVVTHVVVLLLVPGLVAGGTWWLGGVLAVLAVGAGVGLFLPSSTRTFTDRG